MDHLEAGTESTRCHQWALRFRDEAGVVVPIAAVSIFVLVLILFVVAQLVTNTVVQLEREATLVTMIQKMQSASTENQALELGAAVARLNGYAEIEPVAHQQTFPDGRRVEMSYQLVNRVPVVTAKLAERFSLLDGMFEVLTGQNHVLQLTGTRDASLTLSAFDFSESMRGPSNPFAIDELLRSSGIPLDPERGNPSVAARDICSPIDSQNNMLECRKYQLLLPGAFTETSALPDDTARIVGSVIYGTRGVPLSDFRPPDGDGVTDPDELHCGPPCNTRRGVNCSALARQPGVLADPGARTALYVHGGPPIPIVEGAPWCVRPFNSLVNDDMMLGFFSVIEQRICNDRSSAAPAPEMAGSGCLTHEGILHLQYTDFGRAYRRVIQDFSIELDRYTTQVLSVFAAPTTLGNMQISIDGSPVEFNGNLILWDGTEPGHAGQSIFTPVDLGSVFQREVSPGAFFRRSIEFAPGPVVRMLSLAFLDPARFPGMAAVGPSAYQVFRRVHAPSPSPVAPPNIFGQYSSYGLDKDSFRLHPSNPTVNDFVWSFRGDIQAGSDHGFMLPVPRRVSEFVNPDIIIADGWEDQLSVGDYRPIDPLIGNQVAGLFDNPIGPNFPVPLIQHMNFAFGGTDIQGAMKDIREKSEEFERSNSGVKAIGVLATDGLPNLEGCQPSSASAFSNYQSSALAPRIVTASCDNIDFDTHLRRIESELDAFLAQGSGDNLFFFIHMLPARRPGDPPPDPNIARFATALRSRHRLFYINLDYSDVRSFRERLVFALSAIVGAVKTHTVFTR